MDSTHKHNEEMTELWNGTAGQAWVDAQQVLDDMFRPFEELLVEAIPDGARALDVGCGTGATTLAIARRAGAAVGIDLSAPMIARARARAAQSGAAATFVLADAQTHAFEPAAFDRVVSRFGVMFFDEPVRAFANLRRAMRDGGRARVIAWRTAAENPFMTAAERAAAPFVPAAVRRPDGPGQFAFADPDRVRQILGDAGWCDVEPRSIDVTCTLPAVELDRYITRLGPLGRVLHELDEPTRAQVTAVVRAAFEPYVHGSDVRYVAACWLIDARA